ncbi:MAG: nucleotidyltransferase domain-containing protein [Candidatus Dormibacteraceae bacterium]
MADRLAQLHGVLAIHFGGSRAAGTATEGADWDCSIYYRRSFDVGEIRALGWAGTVSEIGGWGPVMNGGAWLTVDSQAVDVHYRDLDEIDRLRTDAAAGTFSVYRSPFFIAGIPSYVPLAELASGIVLRGELRPPEFSAPLRRRGGRMVAPRSGARLGLHRESQEAVARGCNGHPQQSDFRSCSCATV